MALQTFVVCVVIPFLILRQANERVGIDWLNASPCSLAMKLSECSYELRRGVLIASAGQICFGFCMWFLPLINYLVGQVAAIAEPLFPRSSSPHCAPPLHALPTGGFDPHARDSVWPPGL